MYLLQQFENQSNSEMPRIGALATVNGRFWPLADPHFGDIRGV